jgi:hypothetical protein
MKPPANRGFQRRCEGRAGVVVSCACGAPYCGESRVGNGHSSKLSIAISSAAEMRLRLFEFNFDRQLPI